MSKIIMHIMTIFLSSVLLAQVDMSNCLELYISEKLIEIEKEKIKNNKIEINMELINKSDSSFIIYQFNNQCGENNAFGIDQSLVDLNPTINPLTGLWISIYDTKTDSLIKYIVKTSSNSSEIKDGLLDSVNRKSTLELLKDRYGDWSDPKYMKLYNELSKKYETIAIISSRNELKAKGRLLQKLEISLENYEIDKSELYIIVEYSMNEKVYSYIPKRYEKLFIGHIKSNRVKLIVK